MKAREFDEQIKPLDRSVSNVGVFQDLSAAHGAVKSMTEARNHEPERTSQNFLDQCKCSLVNGTEPANLEGLSGRRRGRRGERRGEETGEGRTRTDAHRKEQEAQRQAIEKLHQKVAELVKMMQQSHEAQAQKAHHAQEAQRAHHQPDTGREHAGKGDGSGRGRSGETSPMQMLQQIAAMLAELVQSMQPNPSRLVARKPADGAERPRVPEDSV